MPDNYLTTAQVAQRLGRDASQVRRWCESGRLPATKLGHIWAIEESALSGFETPTRGRPTKAHEGKETK